MHPHLSKYLATKLTDGLQELTLFNEATITNPKNVVELPHFTSLHRLKISGLSSTCDDWQWLKNIQNLQVLELHIGDTNVNIPDNANESSKLVVRDKKTTLSICDLGTTELFCQVLKNLPKDLRDEVSKALKLASAV